jgi:hypothetical protein
MIKRIALAGLVLLIVFNIFPQENNGQKSSDEVLFNETEKYLNKICSLDRIFLNSIAKKISAPGNVYVVLSRDVPVKLVLDETMDLYIDDTDFEDVTIYITSGYLLILENEAELAGDIAHELAHLASLYDRTSSANTYDEQLRIELAADKTAILVLKEMGYRLEAIAEVFERVLSRYLDRIILVQLKSSLEHRVSAGKKLANEIYGSESKNRKDYKEYLVASKAQFKAMKIIVKYLQDKSGK